MSAALKLAWCLPGPIGNRLVSKLVMPRINGAGVRVRTKDGFLMWCDPRDFIQRTVIETGRWDYEVADVIRAHLKPGQLFCDIGANIGYFSLLAAHLKARVVAFEPQPRCVQAIERNFSLNGFRPPDLHQIALSDQDGDMTLYLEGDGNSGAASMRVRNGETIAVRTRRLDDVLEEKPALIKIDVEGAEVRALSGASRILSGPDRPIVICEVSEFSLKQLGSSKDELFALMSSHGYRADVISKVRRSNAAADAIYWQYDAIFSPVKQPAEGISTTSPPPVPRAIN
jgi:FkbM family methyltransferase